MLETLCRVLYTTIKYYIVVFIIALLYSSHKDLTDKGYKVSWYSTDNIIHLIVWKPEWYLTAFLILLGLGYLSALSAMVLIYKSKNNKQN